jgi:hypothetical protein
MYAKLKNKHTRTLRCLIVLKCNSECQTTTYLKLDEDCFNPRPFPFRFALIVTLYSDSVFNVYM